MGLPGADDFGRVGADALLELQEGMDVVGGCGSG